MRYHKGDVVRIVIENAVVERDVPDGARYLTVKYGATNGYIFTLSQEGDDHGYDISLVRSAAPQDSDFPVGTFLKFVPTGDIYLKKAEDKWELILPLPKRTNYNEFTFANFKYAFEVGNMKVVELKDVE